MTDFEGGLLQLLERVALALERAYPLTGPAADGMSFTALPAEFADQPATTVVKAD